MAGWKNLTRRLSFTACCGGREVTELEDMEHVVFRRSAERGGGDGEMNLAMALAAERNSRDVGPGEDVKTLMMLIEETDGDDRRRTMRKKVEEEETSEGGGGKGGDWVCCVCMERDKGAAFIPCGHTFCRVCSRAVWGQRGCCPVCNRPILEVLDIF